ncbi:GGDEF domain-containing response regulator [Candidatus Magnetominusculus xianensis]|uniref:diguanylate cyclase n=1 Tax=Candidatus Magnetominusculus xianensis TaxID=1748249 RepID=A0ABR5SEU5_9BACT|nr:diguanylate cyclase [Candidatus Magnetominusculus xianensis]KWT85014.1 iguanylate cyclase response regulator [Candidatus Magnetominusculus xianensis]MBF0404518.1 diguanylate cyclase [Nitrospirota bacterium]
MEQAKGHRRPTILIVDDEKTNIDVLVNLLNGEFRAIIAKNAEQALKRLESKDEKIDLILLDILMPEMDGYELSRRVKNNILTRNIPIMFITALSMVEDEVKGFEMGAVDYITKPFVAPIVLARVRTHVELKLKRDLCEILAMEDSLTGIPNRRKFDEFLEFQWSAIQRRKSPLSLMLIDVDYFKKYNDNYGHAAGDDCLRKVARMLKSSMPRAMDFVARYGGEEFACILPDTGQAGAVEVAKRLLNAVSSLQIPHEFSDSANHITVSIGVSTVTPPEAGAASDLIETADLALYESKASGRNQISFIAYQ